MITKEQLAQVEAYVKKIFKDNLSGKLTYHDIIHTSAVVRRAGIIAEHSHLLESEKNMVQAAAWFHDLGYVIDKNDHEERSVQMATSFLTRIGVTQETIDEISTCIYATKFPQQPTNKYSEVMCDADMSHLAHQDFFEISLLLRDEINSLCPDCKISLKKYWELTLDIFKHHNYYTQYGQEVLAKRKSENLKKLLEKIKLYDIKEN